MDEPSPVSLCLSAISGTVWSSVTASSTAWSMYASRLPVFA